MRQVHDINAFIVAKRKGKRGLYNASKIQQIYEKAKEKV